MEKKIRRDENLMSVLGKAIIVFGIISTIKLIVVLLSDDDIAEFFKKDTISIIFIVISIVLILIIAAIEMIIRVYIGTSAIKESKGIKLGSAYIVFCVILTITTLFFIGYSFIEVFQDQNYIYSFLAGILLDITTVAMLVTLIITAIKIRVRRKELGKVE